MLCFTWKTLQRGCSATRMVGSDGRWQIFPLAAVSVEEPCGRGQPWSLGESSDLQPLAFLQYLPEFSGEGVDTEERHPTVRVAHGWMEPCSTNLPLVLPGNVLPPPHHSSSLLGCHLQVYFSPHILLLSFQGDPVPPPSTLVGWSYSLYPVISFICPPT